MHIHSLIIGAGLSGIGMAVYLKKYCPHIDFLILEARPQLGGTWDLFQYPNIRSDSDMHTYGFSFHSWKNSQHFASGQMLHDYLQQTAIQSQLLSHIRFEHHVQSLNWDSHHHLWHIDVLHQEQRHRITANFIFSATGYYDYQHPYLPQFEHQHQFQGKLIHAQHFKIQATEDLKDKRIVVIGSGATAMSLAPALAKHGAKVKLVQRSPSYVIALPSHDKITTLLQNILPQKVSFHLIRQRNILLQHSLVLASKKRPEWVKKIIRWHQNQHLNATIDRKHFTPSYKPWQQRLCVDVDAALFQSLNHGTTEIYTDHIQHFTKHGILLQSGQHIDADWVICATGLNLQSFGGATLLKDGQPIHISQHLMYRGILISDIPNLAILAGYPHLAWTLRIEIIATYLCKLLNEMQKRHAKMVYAKRNHAEAYPISTLGSALKSNYVKRAEHLLPRQGKHRLWRGYANYYAEKWSLKRARFDDEFLTFE